MNDGDSKRKLWGIDSSSEDDGCDLLWRLDEERLREHHQWSQKRCLAVRKRTGNAGNAGDAVAVDGLDFGGISDGSGCAANDDTEAAQDIAAVFRECWSAFQRTRGAQGVPDKTHSTEAAMSQDGGHTTEDDGDLLAFLDVERKKEMNRTRVRRLRKRKQEAAMRVQRHEVDADLRPHFSNQKEKELQRSRQRRCRDRTRQAGNDDVQDDLFDNELGADERAECLARLRESLGAEGLDECVCVSCDRLVLRQDTQRVEDTDFSYLRNMQQQLTVDTTDIPQMLVDMYRPPIHLTKLAGTSLSPRGIQSYRDDDCSLRSWMTACNEYDRSIQQGKLPKFEIGNGFCVGCLSRDLRGLTIPERLMTQLVHIAG